MQKEKIMWVLIMTLKFYTAYDHESYHVETVQGFTSEQACRYAGASQEVALRQDLKLKTDGRYTFVCVLKDK